MCGIFGVISKLNNSMSKKPIEKILLNVAKRSISRGNDSSGFIFKNNELKSLILIKGDLPVTELLINNHFRNILKNELECVKENEVFQVMGHARLVTNGSQLKHYNNQPVTSEKITFVHNGIIVNDDELWARNSDINRKFEIDTEILPALIRKRINNGATVQNALKETMEEIEGTVSAAFMFHDSNIMGLCTNNGSLYYIMTPDTLVFASEEHFLRKLNYGNLASYPIRHLLPNTALILNTENFNFEFISFSNTTLISNIYNFSLNYTYNEVFVDGNFKKESIIDPMEFIDRLNESHYFKLIQDNSDSISRLKRCTCCVLPATFPFIEFDENGVCNYCKNYKTHAKLRSVEKLKELVAPFRSKDGRPDCIVPFSGGRDSTYTLHVVKKELGLNPIAFTYDWGMVTDLARRNIARVCGKLGVENIIVSADIKWKRENIRKNVEAWLNSPHLGMIPLFMAGDKYFFYYCNQIKKQTGIKLNIWGINDLENTNFKTGFAGIPTSFNKKRIYSLSLSNQFKLFGFVAQNLIKSPGYINQSVFDSLGSFAVRYMFPKSDYYHLFDYYQWNEEELERLILNEYKWEKAIDTDSTWRIGDGTASFYNYIYYTVAGFTENDTFRSNQIREGMITREEALKRIDKDNEVRYETLRWYLEIIGVDFREVINTVNSIPKLYK